MTDYTIAESYTLPSKGLVYEQKVNPNIKIRSMTTEEEMKRLAYSELPYKMLTEIIDDCLIEKPGIPVYDLCLSDYTFLLHKMRIVTYGSDYKVQHICPYCGQLNKQTIDLNTLEVSEYSADMDKYLHITLPQCKKHIDLKLQTPRILDEIKLNSDERKKKSPDMKSEPAILFTVVSMIEKVDGEVLDKFKLEAFVRKLSMRDVNYIAQSISKISFGIADDVECKCSNCGSNYQIPFPITSEFFGPSID
ncbi:hypothetical protein [uncultured Clostridium sp.]|uniref:T4 family baseplate hub assembly chaperone n=1 Tax=uncultured Clostridium sp. TaxID=59620 RepID=UPI002614F0E8|nr:hypothetical protein [uncultured Clostridium sp.]